MTQNEYRAALRDALPPEAFDPSPRRLWSLLAHWLIIVAAAMVIVVSSNPLAWLVAMLAIAHGLAANAFLAHEISHGNIVRSRPAIRFFETVAWLPVMIAPSMWHKLHNGAHHGHTNTAQDPDRRFIAMEETAITRGFSKLFFANQEAVAWSPLPLLYFLPYLLRNNLAALFAGRRWKPPISPAVPRYLPQDARRTALELSLLLLCHGLLLWALGGDLLRYFAIAVIPVALCSFVLVGFVATQHWLNPIADEADPVRASTTVRVPRVVNLLYHNVGYHTEHHVFPRLNPDYYPELARLLKERYPDRYNEMGFFEAWKKLQKSPLWVG